MSHVSFHILGVILLETSKRGGGTKIEMENPFDVFLSHDEGIDVNFCAVVMHTLPCIF